MRNSFEEWCETADFGLDEIDRRANSKVQLGNQVDLVYVSLDLYSELLKSFYPKATITGPNVGYSTATDIVSLHLSAGHCHINKVIKLRNFCLVGTKEDYDNFIMNGVDPIFWNDQERARINKEFEDIVLKADV